MNTEIKEWHKQTPKHVWRVVQEQTFSVEVVCWWKDFSKEWAWNVYVYIFKDHPLFNLPEIVIDNAPFHCGCTLEDKCTEEPALGIKYQWQKRHEWFKFGGDYSHCQDEYFATCGPDNIPRSVIADANELAEWARVATVASTTGDAA